MGEWITYEELLEEVTKNMEKQGNNTVRPESIIEVRELDSMLFELGEIAGGLTFIVSSFFLFFLFFFLPRSVTVP